MADLDKTPPTIAVTSDWGLVLQGGYALIMFTLSEPSKNFTASDVTVSGGKLSAFSGSGRSYAAIFTPLPKADRGVISVASGKFTDGAGNANADGSDVNNRVELPLNLAPMPGASLSNVFGGSPLSDRIIAGIGNDTLNGGLGNDTLTGGAGADTFVFYSAPGPANVDTITDFVSGVDKIKLLQSVFTKLKAVAVSEASFVSGGADAKALDKNDYLIFNGSQLLYDADGSGKGAAVAVANIVGTVVASDIFVVP
jgi:hypothetical protein